MPAAAISVHPANAVDCEFLNLDFLKDTWFFTACYFRHFCFHDILLSFCVAPFLGALLYAVLIATAMPKNITLIYCVISAGSNLLSLFAAY